MKKRNSISAFFPCYNDGGTIASMVGLMDLTMRRLGKDYEIIVIDDGSSDHSGEILKELAGKYDRLKVIFHEENRGYGGALKSGFYSAGKELIFYTDGDFQYDVSEITSLIAGMNDDVDIVNGYKISRSDPFYRVIIGRMYCWLIKLMFGLKIRDVNCDFRLIRRAVFDRIDLESNSGLICVEMVKKIQNAGFTFAETPVHHYPRAYGKSQFFSFKGMFEMGIGILNLWWRLVVKKEVGKQNA